MFKKILFPLSLILLYSCSKSEGNITPDLIQKLEIDNFSSTIAENPEVNALIGTISVTRENLTDPIIYSLSELSVEGSIEVDSEGNLRVADTAVFDFELNDRITGMVKVSSGTLMDTASFIINLTDLDEAITFISTWELNTSNQTVKLPIYQGSASDITNYDFTVDWGDGTVDMVTSHNDADASHTYQSTGSKTVIITGFLTGFSFGQTPDSKESFYDVTQWGGLKLGNTGRNFEGCTNLIGFSARDEPNLNGITNMEFMFSNARVFNGDISGWDVRDATSMAGMFVGASSFNQDISSWDVSNIDLMTGMFADADSFNQSLSEWDVGSVTDMEAMFAANDVFNQDLSSWDVSSVLEMRAMFRDAIAFNQNLSTWNVSNVRDMGLMFSGAFLFDQNISTWNVSNVTRMEGMFDEANAFNQDLSAWDVGQVTDMGGMFQRAITFNQNLSSWDVGNVESMIAMFQGAISFNQDISTWNIDNVSDMGSMFVLAIAFNQDISSWNLTGVTNMNAMFLGAESFNQDISGWDVSNVTIMDSMFQNASDFQQDLSQWVTDKVVSCVNFAEGSGLSSSDLPTQGCFTP